MTLRLPLGQLQRQGPFLRAALSAVQRAAGARAREARALSAAPRSEANEACAKADAGEATERQRSFQLGDRFWTVFQEKPKKEPLVETTPRSCFCDSPRFEQRRFHSSDLIHGFLATAESKVPLPSVALEGRR